MLFKGGVDGLGLCVVAVDPAFEVLKRLLFAAVLVPACVIDQSELPPFWREPLIGIVLTQEYAVLGAAGEHPVGLIGAFGDQVIDEYADIGFISSKCEGCLFDAVLVAVDACNKSLTCGLLVSGCPIDLTCEIEVAEVFGLKGMVQLGRREIIVFNSVARSEHAHVLKARYKAHGFQLYFFWKGRRKAIHIGFYGVAAFGFYEDLVPVFVCEAVNLVFYTGTVSGTLALDGTIEHGALVQGGGEFVVYLRVGVGDVAGQLISNGAVAIVAESLKGCFARLLLCL